MQRLRVRVNVRVRIKVRVVGLGLGLGLGSLTPLTDRDKQDNTYTDRQTPRTDRSDLLMSHFVD